MGVGVGSRGGQMGVGGGVRRGTNGGGVRGQ